MQQHNNSDAKGLLKTYMQVEKEADAIKSKVNKQAKCIPQIGQRPQSATKRNDGKIKQEIQKPAIKQDITILKQRRQQLEKESDKISQEYKYMKGVITHDLKQQLGINQIQNGDEQEILSNLERVAQETHHNYLRFRTQQCVQKLNTILSSGSHQFKIEFMNKLKHKYYTQQQLIKQFIEFRQYNTKKNILHQWNNIIILEIQTRKNEALLKEQSENIDKHRLAVDFRTFCILNMTFKALWRNKQLNQITKNVDKDQSNIKVKVNEFLAEMKQQVISQLEKDRKDIQQIKESIIKEDEQLYQEQEIDEDEFNISESGQIQNEINKWNNQQQYKQHQFEAQSLNIENEFIEPIEIEFDEDQEEEIQLSVQPSQKSNSSQTQPQIIEQPGVPIQANPWKQPTRQIDNQKPERLAKSRSSVKTIKNVDDKAAKRKQMSEAIKQKQEEKKRIQEQERAQLELQKQQEIQKRKEEEYNRIQQKRKQEQDKIERRERERFEEQYKMEIAIKHHEKQQQKYQIFIPLCNNLQICRQKQGAAEQHYELYIMRRLFMYFKTAQQIMKDQLEYEESIRLNIATKHYNETLINRVMLSFTQNYKFEVKRQVTMEKIREQYLVRNILTAWYIQLPELRAQNLQLENTQKKLISAFRRATLQQLAFSEWKLSVREQVAEKERAKNKDQMWAKVNQWLSEFEQDKE